MIGTSKKVDDGRTATYGDVAAQARTIAETLAEHGVGPGDRIAIYAGKSVEAICAFYGVLIAGSAYVPLDAAVPPERLRRILEGVRPVALVADAGTLDRAPCRLSMRTVAVHR